MLTRSDGFQEFKKLSDEVKRLKQHTVEQNSKLESILEKLRNSDENQGSKSIYKKFLLKHNIFV